MHDGSLGLGPGCTVAGAGAQRSAAYQFVPNWPAGRNDLHEWGHLGTQSSQARTLS